MDTFLLIRRSIRDADHGPTRLSMRYVAVTHQIRVWAGRAYSSYLMVLLVQTNIRASPSDLTPGASDMVLLHFYGTSGVVLLHFRGLDMDTAQRRIMYTPHVPDPAGSRYLSRPSPFSREHCSGYFNRDFSLKSPGQPSFLERDWSGAYRQHRGLSAWKRSIFAYSTD